MTNITNKDLKAWMLSKYWLLRYAESFRNQRGFLQSSGLFRLFALGDLSELHISCLDVLLYILALQDMSTSLETAINERHGKIENHAGVGPTLTCWADIYIYVCYTYIHIYIHNIHCYIPMKSPCQLLVPGPFCLTRMGWTRLGAPGEAINHPWLGMVNKYHVQKWWFDVMTGGWFMIVLPTSYIPVVPHKAVAEVSKIGNL